MLILVMEFDAGTGYGLDADNGYGFDSTPCFSHGPVSQMEIS